jgi:hypothetical protein
MGYRKGRTRLSTVRYCLRPDSLLQRDRKAGLDEPDLDMAYRASYIQVFGEDPGSSGVDRFANALRAASTKLKMTPEQFIFVSMVGHSMTWPDVWFTPNRLGQPATAAKVRVWAEACRSTYGSLSPKYTDRITGRNDADYDLRARMLRSELLAGRWIIKFKQQNEGAPYFPFFDANEQELDANWLAIEPHYETYVHKAARQLHLREGVYEARADVLEAFKRMKRRPVIAALNFQARESIVAEAVGQALYDYRIGPDDLLVSTDVVVDALQLWYWLALAVQHIGVFNNYHEQRLEKLTT